MRISEPLQFNSVSVDRKLLSDTIFPIYSIVGLFLHCPIPTPIPVNLFESRVYYKSVCTPNSIQTPALIDIHWNHLGSWNQNLNRNLSV